MKADRFFSVHYDMRHNPKIDMLRDEGGGIVALGRWVVLMSLLYDSDGLIDINSDVKRRYLCRELELDSDGLAVFLRQCAECDLLSANLLEIGHVASRGICEQIEHSHKKSEAGKKGNAKRWASASGKQDGKQNANG